MPIIRERRMLLAPLRQRLTEYLNAPSVSRQADVSLGYGAVRQSEADRVAYIQSTVDDCLRRVLSGEDPRKIFALDGGRRGLKAKPRSEMAAAFELERLKAEGVSLAEAKLMVAEKFCRTTRTVENWRSKHAKQTSEMLPAYLDALRASGLLAPQ